MAARQEQEQTSSFIFLKSTGYQNKTIIELHFSDNSNTFSKEYKFQEDKCYVFWK